MCDVCCVFGLRTCGVCGNSDGICLASMNEDFFIPATREQVEKRLAEGRYACDKEIMEEYIKTARKQAEMETTVCCESKADKGGLLMPELTKQGYDNIIDRIVNRTVEPPKTLTVQALNAWLNGYAQCQLEILDIIETLRDTNGR